MVQLRLTARALAEGYDETTRLAFAQSFVREVIQAWWRNLASDARFPIALSEAPSERTPAVLSHLALAAAAEIAASAARLRPESAAYEIGLLYAALLPQTYRTRHGVYYTPPALVERLLDRATEAGVNWARCRVLDPACGGGAFLAPLALRMAAALPGLRPKAILASIAERLKGFELDAFAAWMSQVSLDAVLLRQQREAGERLPRLVSVCDTLDQEPGSGEFDLVIGNPPYGRVTLSPLQRERYGRSLHGHANLYSVFTDAAVRHARPNGVIALVTPTSFLAGGYFKNLRSLLLREAPPASFDFVPVRKGVFEDVLQETLLACYRRGGTRRSADVCEAAPGDHDGAPMRIQRLGKAPLPARGQEPWLLPRERRQITLVTRLRSMGHRLADWGYRVSTGPLVWNRHKGQFATRPEPGSVPVIWAEAIRSDGTFLWRAERRNHAPYFRLERGDDWLTVRRSCVLLQRTTAKEQARRLVAAILPEAMLRKHGAVVIENHLNMIRPASAAPRVAPEVLAAFLNSAAVDSAFRCVSGSVAVSAYELESLPLPAPAELAALATAVAAGAGRTEVEAICGGLYGADPAT